MATRLKTIEYAFPTLASLVDNTLTGFTQITVYIPESSPTFRKAVLEVTCNDLITVTGGTINTWTAGIQLGGSGGYTDVTNANDISNSGENMSPILTADVTGEFSAWSGTSMVCDAHVLIDQSTGTTLNFANVSAKLYITYEYNDTSTTHIKTVYIPLDAPTGALATSKPGTANAVIPNLSTFLPENSVTIRDWHIVVQGNIAVVAATAFTMSMQIDSAGATVTTGNVTGTLSSDTWNRYIWHQPAFTTTATHDFFIWASAAKMNHQQIFMVVTYEFNASDTTRVLNSLQLPMEFDSPMGGTTSSDYQRATRNLWIEEPGTITILQSSIMFHWEQASPIAGLNMRVGTGSFTTYTDTATMMCGGNGAMLRCESVLSLSRGENTLQADIYRTDTSDLGFNVGSWWIINYTSDKATDGVGAHNHTVRWNLLTIGGNTASLVGVTISATAPIIPETNYFLTSIGAHIQNISTASVIINGMIIQTERLSGEGGIIWEPVYADVAVTDQEVGIRQTFSTAREIFKRFTGDAEGGNRLDIETSRRWRVVMGSTSFYHVDLLMTYHTITYTVSGTVSGSGGGTVYIDLFRVANDELVMTTSRSGNGTYSFTWYDNTANLYTVAYEDGTHLGRSDNTLAS